MTTSAEIIYQRRVRLLDLAEELGNISAACHQRTTGVRRDRAKRGAAQSRSAARLSST
jgi:hypothetical protein